MPVTQWTGCGLMPSSKPELAGDDHEWGLSLIANKQDNTLTIRDNGCGHGAWCGGGKFGDDCPLGN